MSKYEKIKELCKENGITITGLESELGFARGSLSKIDKNRPRYDRLQKLADYFNLPVEYFMDEVPKTGQNLEYYNTETLEMAQAIYENPDLRELMKAAIDTNKDSLTSLTQLLYTMKGTNPDG